MHRPHVIAALAAMTALVTLPPRPAHADDDPWVNAGVSEVLIVPDVAHYGVYAYVALTLPIDLHRHGLYLIPGVGFEWSPELGHGGFTGYLTAERSLSEKVAGDLILTFVHDQAGLSWDEAVFSLGLGVGVSIAVGELSLSPSLSLYRTIGSPDWSLAPTLNLALPL